ncbi:MAG: ferrous iron transport protein B [Proteobacteria bacterium]|nr:ferrous iron transport protein B [Pseudomonadota bacterium]
MNTTIALAGNPNSGKTTLFNALTGARQHVGNYPGVTVEKKHGVYVENNQRLTVVDLPGTYSLTAYSLEEVVARDFLIKEKPSVVVNIVDASNLERHLYLTVQFMEMGLPVCIALNMMDVARKMGITINIQGLSEALGIPVIPTVARSGKGKLELMQAVRSETFTVDMAPLNLSYGTDLDLALDRMEALITKNTLLTKTYKPRWLALKCLENDEQITDLLRATDPILFSSVGAIAQTVSAHLKQTLDTDPEALIADYRYGFIRSVLKQGVWEQLNDDNRLYISDAIDSLMINRFFGPLFMVAVLFGLYHFTFSLSEIPGGWLESLFGWIGGRVDAHMADGLLKSLIQSGIIDGVGGVLGFAPLIMFMFLGISVLEDTGYLARMAFMLDRVFRIFGLHGSSVMAFIVSGGIAGGCAVPGVMASRTLRSPKERLATLLTVPFMNCGAKLPVFALLVGAFFSENEALMMMVITLISWIGALTVAKVLRMTVIRGESTPFVMELPPYRLPTFKGLLIHTSERTFQYIKKAGTVILGISILLWAMMTFPGLPDSQTQDFQMQKKAILESVKTSVATELALAGDSAQLSPEARIISDKLYGVDAHRSEAALKHSLAGRIGASLEGLTSFAGFDWRTNIALVGGFAAKEVIVSTLGTAYSMGEVDPDELSSLESSLSNNPAWSPLAAFSLIIFTIFYAPCFVTVVCIAREAGSWKWGAFSVIFNTTIAFGLSVLVYQTGTLLGF